MGEFKYIVLAGAIIFIVLSIIYYKKNHERMKDPFIAAGIFIVFTVVLFIADTDSSNVSKGSSTNSTSVPAVSSSNAISGSDTKKFISEDLDKFVRNISSTVDTNWKYYLIEPLERLEQNNDVDTFKSDLKLYIDMQTLTVNKVNDFEIPKELDQTDRLDLMDFRDELSKAVSLRLHIAKSYAELKKASEVLKADFSQVVAESEVHLKKSVEAYAKVVKRHSK